MWIPEVAQRGWLIITRDRHIQDHPAEIAAVRDHGAKLVAFSAADAGSIWNQLEVVMANWRRFEDLVSEPGPFVWRAALRLAEGQPRLIRRGLVRRRRSGSGECPASECFVGKHSRAVGTADHSVVAQ